MGLLFPEQEDRIEKHIQFQTPFGVVLRVEFDIVSSTWRHPFFFEKAMEII